MTNEILGSDQISILVADDHHLIRDALVASLNKHEVFSVTAADSHEAVRDEIVRLGKIDVILLDIVMPGMEGLKSVKEFVELNTGGAVVVFSGNISPYFTEQALTLGARGFIPKTLPLRSLSAAIQLVYQGQIFVPFDFASSIENVADNNAGKLTAKELNIINHVSGGLTNKEIAWKVNIAEVTVKMHMRSICIKLEAKNRAHAVILASKLGLLTPALFLD
jgi:two-component system nitrate/nitrite response regulator NarL